MSNDHSALPFSRGSSFMSQPASTGSFGMPLPNTMNNINNINNVQQQHTQQYPGINSIPGMQSLSTLNPMTSIASFGLPSMNGMSSMAPFSSVHGMSSTHALLHPQSADPLPQPFSVTPLQNSFSNTMTPGIQHGGIDKKRKGNRGRRMSTYNSLMNSAGYTTGTITGGPGVETDPVIMTHPHTTHPSGHHDSHLHPQTPMYEADGIQFKMLEQLPDTKIQRLRTEKIKPIENLTFEDIKAYNRNQLRAYCSVYGIRRKKKADMERDMARYAALFHPGDPAYDISKFEPTEYADGPIPRRKVPVTKEQKEQAAGDFKRLTEALHQRPQTSAFASHHYASMSLPSHHSPLGSTAHHGLPHSSAIAVPRYHDIHTTSHPTVHTSHHGSTTGSAVAAATGSIHSTHPNDEHDGGVGNTVNELLPVPDMHSHLLSIPQQIVDE